MNCGRACKCHVGSTTSTTPTCHLGQDHPTAGRLRLIFGSEENARLVLLAGLLAVYLLSGALLFQWLEADEEDRAKLAFEESRRRFLDAARTSRLCRPSSSCNDTSTDEDVQEEEESLEALLDGLLRANSEGVFNVGNRPRWDLAGSFYFVSTVVSTIGYGMTTPRTLAGKMALIAYGLPGCSCAILFFNLFLERIITLLASVMRCVHEAELRRRGFGPKSGGAAPSTTSRSDGEEDLDQDQDQDYYGDLWKPSVHWVMFYMALLSACVAGLGALLYSRIEDWTYAESLYFCFVSYATIGFGDYVPSRRIGSPGVAYHAASFVVVALGCCCVYSFFNVASIVLKAMLNSILVRLDRPVICFRQPRMSKDAALKMRSRRNAITTNHMAAMAGRPSVSSARAASTSFDMDSEYDDDDDDDDHEGRQISPEDDHQLPVFEELVRLKVSLAVMQKQLYESAQMQRSSPGGGRSRRLRAGALWPPSRSGARMTSRTSSAFLPAAVGPLAIVTSKLHGRDS